MDYKGAREGVEVRDGGVGRGESKGRGGVCGMAHGLPGTASIKVTWNLHDCKTTCIHRLNVHVAEDLGAHSISRWSLGPLKKYFVLQ